MLPRRRLRSKLPTVLLIGLVNVATGPPHRNCGYSGIFPNIGVSVAMPRNVRLSVYRQPQAGRVDGEDMGLRLLPQTEEGKASHFGFLSTGRALEEVAFAFFGSTEDAGRGGGQR